MPRTITIETQDEFVARHGGSPMQVDPHTWLLPDGASVTVHVGLGPIMKEPPDDEYKRLQLQIQYEQTFLERTQRFFDRLKSSDLFCMSGWPDRWLPLPPGVERHERTGTVQGNYTAVGVLKHIRNVYRQHKARLNDLQSRLEQTPQARRQAEIEKTLRESARRRALERSREQEEIRRITLDDPSGLEN